MISEFDDTECFVYITLPGETTPVTAGKYIIQHDKSGLPRGLFVYGKSYLGRADKAPIDLERLQEIATAIINEEPLPNEPDMV